MAAENRDLILANFQVNLLFYTDILKDYTVLSDLGHSLINYISKMGSFVSVFPVHAEYSSLKQ